MYGEPLGYDTAIMPTQSSTISRSGHPGCRSLTPVAVRRACQGVYLAREGEQGPLVYLGMAGSGGAGLHGRPTIYNRGKALASGLGGAVLDPAG